MQRPTRPRRDQKRRVRATLLRSPSCGKRVAHISPFAGRDAPLLALGVLGTATKGSTGNAWEFRKRVSGVKTLCAFAPSSKGSIVPPTHTMRFSCCMDTHCENPAAAPASGGFWRVSRARHGCVPARRGASPFAAAPLAPCACSRNVETWLILPVVIRLSQRLSHACLSISTYTVKLRMAHYISYSLFDSPYYLDNRSNSRANTCAKS